MSEAKEQTQALSNQQREEKLKHKCRPRKKILVVYEEKVGLAEKFMQKEGSYAVSSPSSPGSQR